MPVTNSNSNNLHNLVFKKTIFSANTRRIVFVLLLPSFIFCSLYLKIKEIYLLVFGMPLLIIALIKIIDAVLKPNSISLTNEDIVMGNRTLKWNQITYIQFTVPFDVHLPRPLLEEFFNVILPVQEIRIFTKDNLTVEIYPRIYDDNKKLREMFEKIAKQKCFRTKADDRGM